LKTKDIVFRVRLMPDEVRKGRATASPGRPAGQDSTARAARIDLNGADRHVELNITIVIIQCIEW